METGPCDKNATKEVRELLEYSAWTNSYCAVAPFIGTFPAFVINGEKLTAMYFAGLVLMLVGTAFVVYDTNGEN